MLAPLAYITLPDGRLEQDIHGIILDDVPLEPIVFPLVSSNPAIQSRYEQMRLSGESHNMAEMLALRCFPAFTSDSIFNQGRFSGVEQFADCPAKGAWLRAEAESAGVNPAGKYYLSGLADFPGDPTAWVSDRGDVLRVAREKNLRILDGYGDVKHEPVEREPMADVLLADDIVDDEVDAIVAGNPDAIREDIRERVYALRAGQIDNNPLVVNDAGVGERPGE